MHDTFTTTIDLGELGDVEADIGFSFWPGRPGCMYLPNGDPGFPEEPAELEITSITVKLGSVSVDIFNHVSEDTVRLLEEEIESQPRDSDY